MRACGRELPRPVLAYQTYGTLNADRSNAILVCHALTGDQFVVETHPISGKPGWWEMLVGAGKAIDTDRYFILCVNVIGGCMGSTGPQHVDRKRVVKGKSVSVRVDLGGRRTHKKKTKTK